MTVLVVVNKLIFLITSHEMSVIDFKWISTEMFWCDDVCFQIYQLPVKKKCLVIILGNLVGTMLSSYDLNGNLIIQTIHTSF